jgi:hypothetical protein
MCILSYTYFLRRGSFIGRKFLFDAERDCRFGYDLWALPTICFLFSKYFNTSLFALQITQQSTTFCHSKESNA